MMIFDHDRLRQARLDAALTQDEAAESLGIAPRTYRRYESGQVNHPTHGFRVRHAQRQNLVLAMCSEFELGEEALIVTRSSEAEAPTHRAIREHIVVPSSLDKDALAELIARAWARSPSAELTFIPIAC